MPRRFNPAELGIELGMNVLETYLDDVGDLGWGSKSALSLYITGIKDKARLAVTENKAILPILETAFKGGLFAVLPSMSPESKLAVNSLVDIYTDKVRRSLNEQNDDKAEAQLANASGAFQTEFRKVMEEAKKKTTAKKPFIALFMKLSDVERPLLTAWVGSLDEQQLRQWTAFKERIGTVEELKLLVSYPDTNARFDFLQLAYSHTPTVLETLEAAARGEETPQTKAIGKMVKKSSDKSKAYSLDQKAKTQVIRDRNKIAQIPFWLICAFSIIGLLILAIKLIA